MNKIDYKPYKRTVIHTERETQVSSKNVLHFTPKFEYLKSIIVNGFCSRENDEVPVFMKDYIEKTDLLRILDIHTPDIKNVKIPMVCFSDIVKKAYKSHMKRYGYYGLSLSKDWAISNYVSPVIYVKENTKIHIAFNKIYEAVDQLIPIYKDNLSVPLISLTQGLSDLRNFIKPYNDDKTKLKYYDEREWRYIPKDSFDITKTDTYLKIDFEKLNAVFVKTSKEKKEIYDLIKDKYTYFDINRIRLSSK